MLPIVQRELQTAARNSRLYSWRILSGAAVLLTILLLVVAFGRRAAASTFTGLSFLALLLCLAEGVRKTADTISFEKREGTLGLLFLSTLTGSDIVLGKLTSATIRSLSTLLSFVPILAVTLLMGGTTGGEFWRTILVLILALLMSLSLCLCLSAITRDGALIASIVFLSALSTLPFASAFNTAAAEWIMPINPQWALRSAADDYYSMSPWSYWRGIAYLCLITITSLCAASYVVPRAWQDREVKAKSNHARASKLPENLRSGHRAMLNQNPVMWLMFRPHGHSQFRRFIYATVALIVLSSAVILYLAQGIIDSEFALISPILGLAAIVLVSTVRAARATTQNFSEARSNGALELMLSTPLKVRDILNGQWLALRADLQPAALVAAGLALIILILPIALGELAPLFWIVKSMLEAAMGIATVAVFGVWMGLTSKTNGRAFFKTVALAFVAPYAILCIPTLVIQLVLMLLALDKVHVHFRRFVAERYLANPSLLTAIASSGPNTPPVIRK